MNLRDKLADAIPSLVPAFQQQVFSIRSSLLTRTFYVESFVALTALQIVPASDPVNNAGSDAETTTASRCSHKCYAGAASLINLSSNASMVYTVHILMLEVLATTVFVIRCY